MVVYAEEQKYHLRDRWKGLEQELRALIPVIRTNAAWPKSVEYAVVLESLGLPPDAVKGVGSDLRGIDLSEKNLSGAYLHRAELALADLHKVDLRRAKLQGADLSLATLIKADLREANLCEANLTLSDLGRACLSRANLIRAKLQGTNLRLADLSSARLTKAALREADLSWTELKGAHLTGVDLQEAILCNANFKDADLRDIGSFSGADFTDATWWEAKVDQTTAFYAYLQGQFPRT
jgi:uncharacterized protein YjbI with pentapeptide repeats